MPKPVTEFDSQTNPTWDLKQAPPPPPVIFSSTSYSNHHVSVSKFDSNCDVPAIFTDVFSAGGRSHCQATQELDLSHKGAKQPQRGSIRGCQWEVNKKTYVRSPSGGAAASLTVSDWPLQGAITLEGLQYPSGQWFSTAHQRQAHQVLRVASTLDSPLCFDFAVSHPPAEPSAALIKQNKDFPPSLSRCWWESLKERFFCKVSEGPLDVREGQNSRNYHWSIYRFWSLQFFRPFFYVSVKIGLILEGRKKHCWI